MFLTLVIVTVLTWQNVLCDTCACDLEDSNCLTEAVKKLYPEFVRGGKQCVPSSDPLNVDLIEGNLPTIKYTLFNSTLSGMKTCVPELVKINTKDMTYEYRLECKHLKLTGQYKSKGNVEETFLEGNGDYEVDMYRYTFYFTGECLKFHGGDGKSHMIMKNYKFDIDAKEKIVFDIKNLFCGDSAKSKAAHKYLNENWKVADKILRDPVMECFMVLFVKNINAYMTTVPVEQVFNRYN